MKLSNNFKNYQSMIRDSSKNLPDNFLQCRVVKPGIKVIQARKKVEYSVIQEKDFVSIFNSQTLYYKTFRQYTVPLTFNQFFNVINLEWFMRRFAFNSQSEIKKECKFYSTLVNKTQAFIFQWNNRQWLIQ